MDIMKVLFWTRKEITWKLQRNTYNDNRNHNSLIEIYQLHILTGLNHYMILVREINSFRDLFSEHFVFKELAGKLRKK
jgi:hypothetical protein